jgi:uncharacterized membrane protein
MDKTYKKSCAICHKEFDLKDLMSGDLLSEYLVKLIQAHQSNWTTHDLICKNDLNRFRSMYVNQAIKEDIGEITQLESEVMESIREQELIADDLNKKFDQNLSIGEHLSDKIASFGGSWKFIIIFGTVLFAWIFFNLASITNAPFDPFPFIFLNLVLSCIAAIQAPVIMMSQNRQESKDRMRAELDYKVNLKAELEIRHLKAKLDQLASHQWRRLLEVQELQTQLMSEISESTKKDSKVE